MERLEVTLNYRKSFTPDNANFVDVAAAAHSHSPTRQPKMTLKLMNHDPGYLLTFTGRKHFKRNIRNVAKLLLPRRLVKHETSRTDDKLSEKTSQRRGWYLRLWRQYLLVTVI